MRIPVLLSLPTQKPLVESASAFLEQREPLQEKRTSSRFEPESARAIERVTMPRGTALDTRFAAIPIGRGEGDLSTGELLPVQSARFLVRATIDVDSLEEVPEEIDGAPVYADPVIESYQGNPLTCLTSPAQGTHLDVQRALNAGALAAKGLDGTRVAIAILDSGINAVHLNAKLGSPAPIDVPNSWTLPGAAPAPGQWPVGHGTMCAFDALIMAPNAWLLDYPILRTPIEGGARMSGTVAAAVQAYGVLISGWSVAYAAAGVSDYRGLVVSNSWGMYHTSWDFPVGHRGRYCDNPGHALHLQVSYLARAGADIVFAAGNCGAECPAHQCAGVAKGTIMGGNAYGDVLTVAGCDIHGNRVGYSSQGPSIAGMPQEKPDITGHTHFLGSQVWSATMPDYGTSAACPVVAGCIAAIRTRLPHTTTGPTALFAQLKADAVAGPGTSPGAWNGDYGYGVIDPLATAKAFGL